MGKGGQERRETEQGDATWKEGDFLVGIDAVQPMLDAIVDAPDGTRVGFGHDDKRSMVTVRIGPAGFAFEPSLAVVTADVIEETQGDEFLLRLARDLRKWAEALLRPLS